MQDEKKYERRIYSLLIPVFSSIIVGATLIGIFCLIVKVMKWLSVH
ncbi:MAG: hypothetical protein PHN59_01190 [Candidatus Omnitrophica bacterium]|nr:hypothetical protein [Candidatus Omnitrophota bacterium]